MLLLPVLVSVIVTILLFATYYFVSKTYPKKMIGTGRLFVEAAIVGIVLLILFALIHAIAMASGKWSMTHAGLALQVFMAGMIFHYLFEIFTGNHAYCSARMQN